MPKKETVKHLAAATYQQTQPEIQSVFDEGGFANANQLQMSLAIQMNAEMEVAAPYGQKGLEWGWGLREDQYHDFIHQTSYGEIFEGTLLSKKDIMYLLHPFLSTKDWTDYVNSFGHDSSGAVLLGVRLGSPYVRTHSLPHINEMWALQALSYAIENNQLKKILEVFTEKNITEPLTFFIKKYKHYFSTIENITLKRAFAVALAYLLGEEDEPNDNYDIKPLCETLLTMLSEPVSFSQLDSAFSVGRETFNLHVRMRAIEALLRLSKKYSIPQDLLLASVSPYLETIEENQESLKFYFGPPSAHTKTISEGYRNWLNGLNILVGTGEAEEAKILNNQALNTGEISYLYQYATQKNSEHCLRALFYSATLQGKILPEKCGSITKATILDHCQSMIQMKEYSSEQKLAAACLLSIASSTQLRFNTGINYVLNNLPTLRTQNLPGNAATRLYNQCATAIMYALAYNPTWMASYSLRVNGNFDPIRIKVLHLLTRCLEKYSEKYSLHTLTNKLDKLKNNPNPTLAFCAWELHRLLNSNFSEEDLPQLQKTIQNNLNTPDHQKMAVKLLVSIVRRQKESAESYISQPILLKLCTILKETTDRDIKTLIIFIVAKLLENHLNLKVPFPILPLPENLITCLIGAIKNNQHNETASLAIRHLIKLAGNHAILKPNINTLGTYLEQLGHYLIKEGYCEAVKNNILAIILNFTSYRIKNLDSEFREKDIIFTILIKLIKDNRYTLSALKIFNLFAINKIYFSREIFEALITKIRESDATIVGNIQVLFRNYIHHHDEKLPDATIVLLAKLLQDEKVFTSVRPILNYLIMVEKYHEKIPEKAISSFLDAAGSSQEEIARLGGELIYQSRASLIAEKNNPALPGLIQKIKLMLEKTYQHGMFKTSILLLRTIFETPQISIDTPLKDLLDKLLTKSVLSAEDREMMYGYFLKQEKVIEWVNISILEQAIRDIQQIESLSLSAAKFLCASLNFSLENTLLTKILGHLSQATHRPFLKGPILLWVSEILRKKPSLIALLPQSIIELALSIQCGQNLDNTQETAFQILEIIQSELNTLSFEADFKEILQNVIAQEMLAKAFLKDKNFYSQATNSLIKKISVFADKGHAIGFYTQQYVIHCFVSQPLKHNTALLNLFISMAKNKQAMMQKISDSLVQYLKHNWSITSILEFIYLSLTLNCSIKNALFEEIQKSKPVWRNETDFLILLKILKNQILSGKKLFPDTVTHLMQAMKAGNIEKKKAVASILYLCMKDKKYTDRLTKNIDNKEEVAQAILDVIVSQDNEQSLNWITLYRNITPTPKADIALYFQFKEEVILRTDFNAIRLLLSEMCQKSSPFYAKISKSVIKKIQTLVMQAFENKKELTLSLNMLIALINLYSNAYQFEQEMIEQWHIFTLTQTDFHYFRATLDLIELISPIELNLKQSEEDCANILKYIIRHALDKPNMLARALGLFKKFNAHLKEFPQIDDSTLLENINKSDTLFSSPNAQWLNDCLEKASENKISGKHEYYRKKIEYIIHQSEKMQLNLKLFQRYFDVPFSQTDWSVFSKIFELCTEDSTIDIYGWKLTLLIQDSLTAEKSRISLTELLSLCQILVIFSECDIDNHALSHQQFFTPALLTLLQKKWEYTHLITIGKHLKTMYSNTLFFDFFDKLARYAIEPLHALEIIKIVSKPSQNLINELHDFFIRTYFFHHNDEKFQEKVPRELVEEFSTKNSLHAPEEKETLINFLQNFSNQSQEEANWTRKDIQEWLDHKNSAYFQNPDNLNEILLVISRAIKFFSADSNQSQDFKLQGFGLRASQCLVIKSFLRDSGHLLGQLATGEGKSVVIAVIALIKVLQGHKVDIVVSSPLFAESDCAYIEGFFKLFGKTVAHNNHHIKEDPTRTQPLPCYLADVVYGDISQFQFDVLSQEFKQSITLGARAQDYVIVDEADNVLLDCATNIAKLAEYLPAFDYLEFIYTMIWSHLCALVKEDKDRNTSSVLEKKLRETMKNVLAQQIKQEDKAEIKLIFPEHLKDYIDTQMPIWISNALFVFFETQKNRDYVVRTDENGIARIVPVDYQNTGMTLLNMQWSDGTHQFLQLKEGVNLIPETLTTNFLSNFSFIKRYQHIMGLTGTLGSEKTRTLLTRVYSEKNKTSMECRTFPSHKRQQLHEYTPNIVSNESNWKEKIKNSIQHEINIGRAVLVIFSSIHELQITQKYLEEALEGNYKIKSFKRSDEEIFENNGTLLESQQIFLTTNLGGRGIDPKVSRSVQALGGLHVIMAYFAENQRVFEQGIGRTARNGNSGTAEQIINTASIIGTETIDISLEDLLVYRDLKETTKFETLENELQINALKDTLFKDFCSFLKEMTGKWTSRKTQYHQFFDWAEAYLQDVQKNTNIQALIERWGLWLKKIENDSSLTSQLNEAKILAKFKKFKKLIEKDEKSNKLIQNPCYLLQQNNAILGYLQSWAHALSQLGGYSERCHQILLKNADSITDPIFLSQAHAIKGYSLLVQEQENTNAQAEKSFQQAVLSIQNDVLPLLLMQQQWLAQVETCAPNNPACAFREQITDKISILSTFARSYEEAMLQIRRARKLIDITLGDKTYPACSQKECLTHINSLSQQLLHSKITLRFHDLRIVYDMNQFVREEPLLLLNTLEKKSRIQPSSVNIIFESYTEQFYENLFQKIIKAFEKTSDFCALSIQIKRASGLRTILASNIHKELNNVKTISSVTFPIKNWELIKRFIAEDFYLEIEDAVIEVSALSNTQAKQILEEIKLKEESFKKTYLREISTIFSSPKQYPDVNQFMMNGLYYLFELKERRPLQIYTMGTLIGIACAQIIVGSVLLAVATPTVFGAGVAIGLIADGIAEFFEVARVGVTREHHWMHYGVQKAVSLSLILITAGISHAVAVSAAKANASANAAKQSADGIKATRASTGVSAKLVGKKEIFNMIVKSTSVSAAHESLKGLSQQFGPQLYEDISKKIQLKVDEALHISMREHAPSIKQILSFARLMDVVDLEKRLSAEIAILIKTDLHARFHENFIGQMSAVQLLQDNQLIEAIDNSTRTSFAHIMHEQTRCLNMNSLIAYYFEQKNLDASQINNNTDTVATIFSVQSLIDKSNGRVLERFTHTVNWQAAPSEILPKNREDLFSLYQKAHRLIYNTLPPSDPNRLQTKALRDALYQVITQMLLTEIIGGVLKLEAMAISALKGLPELAFPASQFFSASSLTDLDTWHFMRKIFDARRINGVTASAPSSLAKFIVQKMSAQAYLHPSEAWLEERAKWNASPARMQRISSKNKIVHEDVDRGFVLTQGPLSETKHNQDIMGISFASDRTPTVEAVKMLFKRGVIDQFFNLLENTPKAPDDSLVWEQVHFIYRVVHTLLKNAGPYYHLLFSKKPDHIPDSQVTMEYLELFNSDAFWEELLVHAHKIPLLHEKIKEKLQLMENRAPKSIKKIHDMILPWLPEAFVRDILSIVKDVIKTPVAVAQLKILLGPQSSNAMREHALLDLLATKIHATDKAKTVIITLQNCLNISSDAFVQAILKQQSLSMFLNKKMFARTLIISLIPKNWIINVSNIILSALASSNDPKLHTRLKSVIEHYIRDQTFLLPMIFTRLLYENKSLHQELSKYCFNNTIYERVFYDINLSLIAYAKAEYMAMIRPIFRILNQITGYVPLILISASMNVLPGIFSKQTPSQLLYNSILLSAMLIAFSEMVTRDFFRNPTSLQTFYPEVSTENTQRLHQMPISLGNNSHTTFANSAKRSSQKQQQLGSMTNRVGNPTQGYIRHPVA